MAFSSWHFVALVLLAALVNTIIPVKRTKVFLNLVSGIFYCYWNGIMYGIIVFITAILKITTAFYHRNSELTKLGTVIAVILVTTPLLFFKYLNYYFPFSNSVILPLGISFYTFQGISYIMDLRKSEITIPNKDFNSILFYISFFPQILSGPIEKYNTLTGQISDYNRPNGEQIHKGLMLILFGLSKKILVANKLALISDTFYYSPSNYSSGAAILSIFSYSWQLYMDFSGYIDIAIGCSLLLGINLSQNFRKPYLSVSLRDFWRKWHITLHVWFVHYVYKPLLEMNWPNRLVVFLVFLLSGIWHGASYMFLFWALGHFIFYEFERMFRSMFRVPKVFRVITTFILVSILWVPFRSPDYHTLILVLKSFISFNRGSGELFNISMLATASGWKGGVGYIFGIIAVIIIIIDHSKFKVLLSNSQQKTLVLLFQSIIFCAFCLLLLLFSDVGSREFYYFQF